MLEDKFTCIILLSYSAQNTFHAPKIFKCCAFTRPQKENEHHRKAMKGAAFRLNMHPTSYFDSNPFKSDKPLPPAKAPSSTKSDIKPFRPSNPGRQVCIQILLHETYIDVLPVSLW